METRTLEGKKSVNLGVISRNAEIRKSKIDAENRTVELTFSSEEPYERWFGMEILSHKSDHVDMSFIASGNAPFLAGHNREDVLGVIEKAWLQEGVGRAQVRFGKSDRANEFFEDVKDGIRKNVSVSYSVSKMEEQGESKENIKTFLVTRWKPLEASLVSIPADETVGIRSAENEVETTIIRKEKEMTEEIKETPAPEAPKQKAAPVIDMKDIRDAERRRQADIMEMGKMAGLEDAAQTAIRNGESAEEFRVKAFDAIIAKAPRKPAAANLSAQEKRDMAGYSFLKAIHEAGEQKLSGIELEMHQEGRKNFKNMGISASGSLSIPFDVLAQRDLTVGTDSQGGYTVATNLLTGSFIELLQNRMMVKQMGATVLDNLVGSIKIPGQATGATVAWEGENDANAESSPTFSQLSLDPNRIGTYTEISKQLLVQSSLSVESIVRGLLADSIAIGMDLAALHGPGTGDAPTGIASTSGIGSVAGGTDGLAPTWAHILELETDVAVANADVGRMGYLTNAKVRGKLKGTLKASSVAGYIWGDNPSEPGFGMLNGYRAGVSNQVSSTLTKGSGTGVSVCSAIFFGNWRDLVLAFWGGLDMVIDPYSLATTNLTRITANAYADVGIRHAASFSAMLDALTT